jgi:beta-glucosidase
VAVFTGVTAFPAPITLAASWDRALVRRWGAAMAAEQRGKGAMVELGPMLNLVRSPTAGRNFESFGEDPWLAAELAAADIDGIQSQKVIATAKHYVGNEQETARLTQSSEIDQRTLEEVYYAPFQAAVLAGVGALMCSYNRLQGVYACENAGTLSDLKQEMGFSGWVMSDWGATHSTISAANAGLDMEMPGADWFGGLLESAVDSGSVAESRLDDMLRRILTSLVRIGVLDDPPTGTPTSVVTSAEHAALAREAAIAGMTLLRNQNHALPLDGVSRLAVIGSAASTGAVVVGGGSAFVLPPYLVTPLDGIRARCGAAVDVVYAPGDGASLEQAVTAAASADAAIVFVGVSSTEGEDRACLALPAEIDSLLAGVAQANPRTVVVLNVPGAILAPWVEQVAAVLVGWYPGQESGHAIAAVLFGDENPGGKLPVSFPRQAGDLPTPGLGSSEPYAEGLAVGYRGLDVRGLTPLFPFGHGLSYTSFEYRALTVTAGNSSGEILVGFELTNLGAYDGSEVPQLYLGFPELAAEPPRVLRGFERVRLGAGESRQVVFTLTARDLAVFGATNHARYLPSGTYRVAVGSSARDIRLESEFELVGFGSSQ